MKKKKVFLEKKILNIITRIITKKNLLKVSIFWEIDTKNPKVRSTLSDIFKNFRLISLVIIDGMISSLPP